MISVQEARQKVILHSTVLGNENKSVTESVGYTLANDIFSPLSLPSFRQSSMDGYAVNHLDILSKGVSLPVVSESKAGQKELQVLSPGTVARIFTGAPVPDGATAVVMQEHTRQDHGNIIIDEYPVDINKNVRQIGQQIKKGDVALSAGTRLTPGSIGFLLGLNIERVEVVKMPRVGLLVTGDELIKPGSELGFGEVFESNSAMLVAALHEEGISEVQVYYASDDLDSTVDALNKLSENNDVILASGGVSVGDYDFVGKALEQIGTETIFYKVRQKPGKPLLFAKKVDKHFFALPGNPASSLVCFYEYVVPALRKMSGRTDCFLRKLKLPSTHAYSFNGERDEFLKAIVTGDEVMPLDGQESFALRSFAIANALIYLPVTQPVVSKGDLVEVHLLPLKGM
jgi:molybdopterin molybdotransferase